MMTVQQAFALALQHHQAGRLPEAEALYRQILAVQPKHAEALHLVGVIAHQIGNHAQAVQVIRQAIAIDPRLAIAYCNLGEAQRAMGQSEESVANYRRAIEIQPDYPEAHNNLGNALRELGQSDNALASYRRALKFRPDSPEIYNNLGNALRARGRIDEAMEAFRRALELNPNLPETHNNLGNTLKDQGLLEQALEAYRRALQIRPGDAGFSSNVVYTLLFLPGEKRATIAEEQRRWNQQIGVPLKRFLRPHANDRDPERRLRIGYVSPDFQDHVIGRNLFPLLKNHDHRNVEILCYSGSVRADEMTEGFRRHSDQWRSTVGVTDEALAEMIRQDGVDILVDLTQHMMGNRLPMFARQPAPVQVSFAGYPDSTGVETIEYRLSDRYIEGEASLSEAQPESKGKVILIDSFWCYYPCGVEVEVSELPAKENGRVTFGSLTNFCKINEPVLQLWARVLGQVHGSRLMLLSLAGSERRWVMDVLQRSGVDLRCVDLMERCPRETYLELYHDVDIALDPIPYNGHTTSLDALWMGVPVVSLAGQTRVSRGGLSILSNLGLPELVAHSEEEYVEIATHLARDLSRLTELRRTLRTRLETSVLMDAPRFARSVETAYRTMWRQWCTEKAAS